MKRSKSIFSTVIMLAMTGMVMSYPATSFAQDSYVKHFQSYQAAQAAGDTAKAIIAAKAAWDAAETELGDHELTGILAYNYGSSLLATDPKSSKKSLKRAKKLHEKGVAKLPINNIKGYLAYVDYVEKPGQDTAVKLREALSFSLDNGIAELTDAFMWLNMASLEAKQLRFWNAEPAAHTVVQSIESRGLEEESRPALNNMLIIRAATGLSGRDKSSNRVTWAIDDLDRVLESLGNQKDVKSLDPVFVQALAWKAVGLKMLEDQGASLEDFEGLSLSPGKTKPNCEIVWSEQKEAKFRASPAYPQGLYPGYAGAALISYNISNSGKIENARLITQVPNSELGSTALRAFKKWKIATPPNNTPECRKNQIASFVYYSDWPPL